MRAHALRILEQLGLVTLIWVVLCCTEIAVHAPAIDPGAVLAYLPGPALLWSALFGACVYAVHTLHGKLLVRFAERPRWVLGITALVLLLAAFVPIYALSAILVEGAWIAKHPQVLAIHVALVVALELLWLLAWAFHAASFQLRTRWMHALWWTLSIVALAVASFLLQGPLRAYEALAQHSVCLAWLIALSIALRLHAAFPRATRATSLCALAIGLAACVRNALDTDETRYARSETLASSSFAAIADTLISQDPSQLGHLAFEHVRTDACPEPRTLTPLPLSDAQRSNVIWISVDTMRRDAIGKRFGDRVVAPNLEAFGKRSVFFSRAVAPAAGTLYSLGSALTGYSVSQLLFMPKTPGNVFRRTQATLQQQHIVFPDWPTFHKGPYKKLLVQKANVSYVNHKRKKKNSPLDPFLAALDAARAKGERGFFWLHLVDPHDPYGKHKSFDFGDTKRERYYGEVAYDDAIIGRALAHLEAHGYFDNSLIAIFADHGESLGEGGDFYGHGVSMKARFTDIPIYVRYPGVAPRTSSAAVTLTSLAATTLHYLGQTIPAALTDCSLLEPEAALARCPLPVSTSYGLSSEFVDTVLRKPLRSSASILKRKALIEAKARFAPEIAFTTKSHRYLINLKTGAERLFDRERDGSEKENLIRREPAIATRFRAAVQHWSTDEATRIACAVEQSGARNEQSGHR